MELISREEAIDALCKAVDNKGKYEGEWLYTDEFVKVVQSLPTIEERKEGQNLKAGYPSLYKCSECGWECWDTVPCDTETFNYCPNCGAKTKGE